LITFYSQSHFKTSDYFTSYWRALELILWVQDKNIMEVEYTPGVQVLNKAKLGILSANLLPLVKAFRNREVEFGIFSFNSERTW